jgi:sugar lactone lactonase YvrE
MTPAAPGWGTFGYDLMANADPQPTDLLCVHPDGSIVAAAGGLLFPNGTVIDDTTLVVAETVGRRLTAFTVADDGTLTDRRRLGGLQRRWSPK